MTSLIFPPFTKMVFIEDKQVIKFLRQNKHYGAKRFLKDLTAITFSCVATQLA